MEVIIILMNYIQFMEKNVKNAINSLVNLNLKAMVKLFVQDILGYIA